jgi:hypothetical protein
LILTHVFELFFVVTHTPSMERCGEIFCFIITHSLCVCHELPWMVAIGFSREREREREGSRKSQSKITLTTRASKSSRALLGQKGQSLHSFLGNSMCEQKFLLSGTREVGNKTLPEVIVIVVVVVVVVVVTSSTSRRYGSSSSESVGKLQ